MSQHRPYLQWSMGAAGPVLAALDSGADATWQDFAACAQADPDAFFPEPGGSHCVAKKVCAGCEVRAACLNYALEHNEVFGIWGGLSYHERRELRHGLADAA